MASKGGSVSYPKKRESHEKMLHARREDLRQIGSGSGSSGDRCWVQRLMRHGAPLDRREEGYGKGLDGKGLKVSGSHRLHHFLGDYPLGGEDYPRE
jgi:hypothetical protein